MAVDENHARSVYRGRGAAAEARGKGSTRAELALRQRRARKAQRDARGFHAHCSRTAAIRQQAT
jgi:hypothetical protein